MGLKKIYDEDGNHVGQIDDGKSGSSGGNSEREGPGCVTAILILFIIIYGIFYKITGWNILTDW